jgi:hypothetical protein
MKERTEMDFNIKNLLQIKIIVVIKQFINSFKELKPPSG